MTWFRYIRGAVVSGVLLGSGFMVPILWPLGIVGIAVLYSLISGTGSWLRQAVAAYLSMYIKFLFVLSFYWSMYPLTWLPFDFGSAELLLIGLYWMTVASFLAWSGPVLVMVWKAFKRIPAPQWLAWYIFFPLAWIVAELAGSFSLSLFTLGPGSTPNTSFSLGYVGYLLGSHHFFALLARVGGVFVLSAVTVALGVLLWKLWLIYKKKCLGVVLVLIALTMLTTTLSFPVQHNGSADSVRVALIHTSEPVEALFERSAVPARRERQIVAMESALSVMPDYVLWPEDARYFSQLAGPLGVPVFAFTHATASAVVIDSQVVRTEQGRKLQAYLYDAETTAEFKADKRYLVPQGEFMPYLYQVFFTTIGLSEMVEQVAAAVSYVRGSEIAQSHFSERLPGVLFCFESTDALGVRALLRERLELPFIAHPVSHVWFHEPKTFWSQLDTALRVQAIWNNVHIAVAANHAPNKVFTPLGQMVTPQPVATGEYWSVDMIDLSVQ